MIGDVDLFNNNHEKQVRRWNQDVPQIVNACADGPIWQYILVRPGNEAVCLWDGSLTYAMLAKRSDRLASYLVIALQVGPESLVPVCFYKSKWSVVAISGVMKAGELLCC